MGLFSKLFGQSDLQIQLEAVYVPILQTRTGMTSLQAQSAFRDLYRQAENEATKEGTINLPINLGDVFLAKESSDQGQKRGQVCY